MVADHPNMVSALEQAGALAQSSAPLPIFRTTGTGTELMAKFVQLLSGRSKDNFIALNCASITVASIAGSRSRNRKRPAGCPQAR